MKKFKVEPRMPERPLTENQVRLLLGWANLLDSGMFRRAAGMLREVFDEVNGQLASPPAFCCLGVLQEWQYPGSTQNIQIALMGMPEAQILMRLGLDLDKCDAIVVDPLGDYLPKSLPQLNDDGATFAQIARIIRRYALNMPGHEWVTLGA